MNRISKGVALLGVGVLAVAAVGVGAFAFMPRTAPAPTVDPTKAQQFQEQTQKEIADAFAAYQDSLKVKLAFPKDRPLRWMVAGDSLAGGYYTTTEDKQFRKLVSAELSKHGATEEVKAAQSGANLSTVGGLVGIPKDLGLAVIELGTNDTAGKTAVEAFAQQYDSLLRSVKEGSPNVGIICVGPWGAPGAGTDPYDVAVETSCKKAGGQFVKISTVFAGLENRSKKGDPSWLGPSDAFHPNDLGHERIADLILERIKVS